MKNETNENEVYFNPIFTVGGCIGLFWVGIFIFILQFITNQFDIIASLIAIFLFVYTLVFIINNVKSIVIDDSFVLSKTFKTYRIFDVSYVYIIKWGDILIFRIKKNNKKSLYGINIDIYNEQKNLLKLIAISRFDYRYMQFSITKWIFKSIKNY